MRLTSNCSERFGKTVKQFRVQFKVGSYRALRLRKNRPNKIFRGCRAPGELGTPEPSKREDLRIYRRHEAIFERLAADIRKGCNIRAVVRDLKSQKKSVWYKRWPTDGKWYMRLSYSDGKLTSVYCGTVERFEQGSFVRPGFNFRTKTGRKAKTQSLSSRKCRRIVRPAVHERVKPVQKVKRVEHEREIHESHLEFFRELFQAFLSDTCDVSRRLIQDRLEAKWNVYCPTPRRGWYTVSIQSPIGKSRFKGTRKHLRAFLES